MITYQSLLYLEVGFNIADQGKDRVLENIQSAGIYLGEGGKT